MNLRINGIAKNLENQMALAQLIEQITGEKDPQGVAVAINGSVISRSLWHEKILCNEDDIEILGAVSGG